MGNKSLILLTTGIVTGGIGAYVFYCNQKRKKEFESIDKDIEAVENIEDAEDVKSVENADNESYSYFEEELDPLETF